MHLAPGTRLGRYDVRSLLGAGGMGEVYLAHDSSLRRNVAIKVLPGDAARDRERLRRFEQEAHAASSLNHPNILTIHEIGVHEGTPFVATELVEGESLRQRMNRERLELREVVDIGIQVASALGAAHAAGIVHRDIKPENIMVRKDGIVKVLDFGLAKLTEKHDSSSEATTMAWVNTEPGTVLGTAAYMSPEQAIGREVDSRSDLWSLGVVLYEMLTSHAPFEGVSKSHVIVAITDREPLPVTQLAPEIPDALEWIVAEALTKDPDERCQTAKEMLGKLKRLKQRMESGNSDVTLFSSPDASRRTMDDPRASTAESTVVPTRGLSESVDAKRRSHKKTVVALSVLGLVVASALGYGLYKLFSQPRQFGPVRMTALTTGGKINSEDINGQLSISPDGKYVVCAANDTKQQASLWLRQISTNSLVRIVAPENGGYLEIGRAHV